MFIYKVVDSTNLLVRKPSTPVQSDRVKPELCQFALTLHMDMRAFITISRKEEETIWPDLSELLALFRVHTACARLTIGDRAAAAHR